MHVASFTLIHDNVGLVVSIVLFPGRLWLQLQAEADRNSNQAGWGSHVHTFRSGFWPSLSFNSDTTLVIFQACKQSRSWRSWTAGYGLAGLALWLTQSLEELLISWYPLLSRRCWSLTSAWRWGDVSMTSLTVSCRLLASGRQGPGWPG